MISKNNLIYYFILIILIIILIRRFSFLNIEHFINEDDKIKKLIYKHNLVLTGLKKKINENIVKNINRKNNRDRNKNRNRDRDRDRDRNKNRDRDRKKREKHINYIYDNVDDIQINTYNETSYVPITYQDPELIQGQNHSHETVYTREDSVSNDKLYHTLGRRHLNHTYGNVDDIQINTNSENHFAPIAPIAYQDPVYRRDTRVLNDKLYPPLGRTERPQFDLLMN
jgi:hypothetical protein